MIDNMTHVGNKVARNLYEKINNLSSELMSRNLLNKCTEMDKKRISVIINEIKYDVNRIKNLRFIK